MMLLNDLDDRISRLELDGTFAFHAALVSYSSIPTEAPVIFNGVNVNLGDGYDSTTGIFTAPPGGAGLYYFYTHLLFLANEYSNFIIRHNGADLCDAFEDNDNGDHGMSSCGAAVVLEEGKTNICSKINPVSKGCFHDSKIILNCIFHCR